MENELFALLFEKENRDGLPIKVKSDRQYQEWIDVAQDKGESSMAPVLTRTNGYRIHLHENMYKLHNLNNEKIVYKYYRKLIASLWASFFYSLKSSDLYSTPSITFDWDAFQEQEFEDEDDGEDEDEDDEVAEAARSEIVGRITLPKIKNPDLLPLITKDQTLDERGPLAVILSMLIYGSIVPEMANRINVDSVNKHQFSDAGKSRMLDDTGKNIERVVSAFLEESPFRNNYGCSRTILITRMFDYVHQAFMFYLYPIKKTFETMLKKPDFINSNFVIGLNFNELVGTSISNYFEDVVRAIDSFVLEQVIPPRSKMDDGGEVVAEWKIDETCCKVLDDLRIILNKCIAIINTSLTNVVDQSGKVKLEFDILEHLDMCNRALTVVGALGLELVLFVLRRLETVYNTDNRFHTRVSIAILDIGQKVLSNGKLDDPYTTAFIHDMNNYKTVYEYSVIEIVPDVDTGFDYFVNFSMYGIAEKTFRLNSTGKRKRRFLKNGMFMICQ
jgi:hypothetical protein